MCPEVYINEKLIADVPDKSGQYTTVEGKPIYVNVDGIHSDNSAQTIIVEAEELAGRPGSRSENGRREIQLSQVGVGKQQLRSPQPEKGIIGPMMKVVLKDRPIGWASRNKYGEKAKGLSLEWGAARYIPPHPKWQQGHGRR